MWQPDPPWEPELPTWQPDDPEDSGIKNRMLQKWDQWWKDLFAPEAELDRKEEERKKRKKR